MKLGEFELYLVSDGTFRLDGGAMFGTIPKVLWEKTNPADDRNRILLGLNCLLIRTPTETILVDTGIGTVYDEKFAFLYAVDKSQTALLRSLAAVGVGAEDITKVILTHLHFDHSGGNCFREGDGEFKPTFPNAAYYINRDELAYAKQPDSRSRPSYLPHLGAARKAGTGHPHLWGRGDRARCGSDAHARTHAKPSVHHGAFGWPDRMFSGRPRPDPFAPENALYHGI